MEFFYLSKKEISNIILHIIFIATFLAIFFFTYTATVEKNIVENQLDLILNNLFNDTQYLSDDIKSQISQKLADLETPDMSKEDEKAKQNNQIVLNNAIKIISITSVCGLAISYYLFKNSSDTNKGTYFDLLKENILLLLSIALTEYFFINAISKNYVYGDTNFVKKQILISLKKHTK